MRSLELAELADHWKQYHRPTRLAKKEYVDWAEMEESQKVGNLREREREKKIGFVSREIVREWREGVGEGGKKKTYNMHTCIHTVSLAPSSRSCSFQCQNVFPCEAISILERKRCCWLQNWQWKDGMEWRVDISILQCNWSLWENFCEGKIAMQTEEEEEYGAQGLNEKPAPDNFEYQL